MLHFRPDLVRMNRLANVVPASVGMDNEFALLRPTGPAAFAWIAQDIHPAGGAGDATRGTAEKGRATAEYQAERFIVLLRDATQFSLERLV